MGCSAIVYNSSENSRKNLAVTKISFNVKFPQDQLPFLGINWILRPTTISYLVTVPITIYFSN